ncbi:hypothetical protein GQ53DRAFT_820007 [Thozetella sp. PMI_491]|nr:hypothetical protein GQ53DRAFT_820007 [Thozetella sp. PMI_491]
MIRDSDLGYFQLSSCGDGMSIVPSKAVLSGEGCADISFIEKRQRALKGTASVVVSALALLDSNIDAGLFFGLAYYKDEHRFARTLWNSVSDRISFAFVNRFRAIQGKQATDELESIVDGFQLSFRVDYTPTTLRFLVAIAGHTGGEEILVHELDTIEIPDDDFVGLVSDMIAVSPVSELSRAIDRVRRSFI